MPASIFFYQFHKDSFNAYLCDFHLICHHDLLQTTLITNLILRITHDMHNSSLAYELLPLSAALSSSILPHEIQAL
jgi:hypothetical protein